MIMNEYVSVYRFFKWTFFRETWHKKKKTTVWATWVQLLALLLTISAFMTNFFVGTVLGCVKSLHTVCIIWSLKGLFSDICPPVWYSLIFLGLQSRDIAIGLITSHRAFSLPHFTRITDNSVVSGQRGDTPDFFWLWFDVFEVNGGIMEGFLAIQCSSFSRWQHDIIGINRLTLALLLNILEDECSRVFGVNCCGVFWYRRRAVQKKENMGLKPHDGE